MIRQKYSTLQEQADKLSQAQTESENTIVKLEQTVNEWKTKYNAVLLKSEAEEIKYQSLLTLLQSQDEILISALQEVQAETDELYGRVRELERNGNRATQEPLIPMHSAVIIQCLIDLFYLALGQRDSESAMVSKIDNLQEWIAGAVTSPPENTYQE